MITFKNYALKEELVDVIYILCFQWRCDSSSLLKSVAIATYRPIHYSSSATFSNMLLFISIISMLRPLSGYQRMDISHCSSFTFTTLLVDIPRIGVLGRLFLDRILPSLHFVQTFFIFHSCHSAVLGDRSWAFYMHSEPIVPCNLRRSILLFYSAIYLH